MSKLDIDNLQNRLRRLLMMATPDSREEQSERGPTQPAAVPRGQSSSLGTEMGEPVKGSTDEMRRGARMTSESVASRSLPHVEFSNLSVTTPPRTGGGGIVRGRSIIAGRFPS